MNKLLILALLIAGFMVAPAQAHGVRIIVGYTPCSWLFPCYVPVVPVYVAPAYSAPAYVQQAPALPQAPTAPAYQSSDWNFCRDSNAYYPYVKECASGWVKVPSQPSP